MTDTGAVKFLADVFSPRSTAPVFLASLPNTRGDPRIPPRKILTRESDKLAAFAAKWDKPDRALYFCVATLAPGSRERCKAALAELVQLHLDLDFKDIVEDSTTVEAALIDAKLPPNRIVRSGHGLHAYWWLETALEATEDTIAHIETMLRQLADGFAGDRSVAECSRLMRIPSSHNSKNGEWAEVTIAEAQHDNPYTIKKLEKWLAGLTPALTRKPRVGNAAQDPPADFFAEFAAQFSGAPIDVEGRLAAMAYHGPNETAVHPTQVSCTAALLSRGMTLENVVAEVLAATQAMAERDGIRGWDWRREEAELRGMCESWLRKRPDIGTVELEEGEAGPAPPPPLAGTPQLSAKPGPIHRDDFFAYMTSHTYIYVPTRDLWPASSVNSVVPPVPLVDRNGQPVLEPNGKPKKIAPTKWLDKHRRVVGLTWAPGFPEIIRDRVVTQAGWRERRGAWIFNLYLPPVLVPGDAAKAGPWVELVNKVYPNEAKHIAGFLAHRVQRPFEKINHVLVLGGAPGIGKDTIVAGVREAIGAWNMQEIAPTALMSNFNGYAKSVVLRISEAHDTGDLNRFQFYERLKVYAAAPPDTLRINEKYTPEYHAFNVCGVIITTNYKTDSLYLPPDDRRHFIAWSEITKEAFPEGYWTEFWAWYRAGGYGHVAAYLAAYDLNEFKAQDPPPKTDAFWAIADANTPPEVPELLDAIDELDNAEAFTLDDLRGKTIGELEAWLGDRRNRRLIPHRLETCGYVQARNPSRADGLWVVDKVRQAIYVKESLTAEDRLEAAQNRQESSKA
jgi:hypothetical protein